MIDHLGTPPTASGQLSPWAARLADAAAHPRVYAKLSGLTTAAPSRTWHDLVPYVDHAFNVLGADRLMYGGDWPVSRQADGYRTVWQTATNLLSGRSDDERAAVLGGTAATFYGITTRTTLHPIGR